MTTHACHCDRERWTSEPCPGCSCALGVPPVEAHACVLCSGCGRWVTGSPDLAVDDPGPAGKAGILEALLRASKGA